MIMKKYLLDKGLEWILGQESIIDICYGAPKLLVSKWCGFFGVLSFQKRASCLGNKEVC